MVDQSISKIQSGADRFGESRSLGISRIAFKLSSLDGDSLFIIENTFDARGGPAKHLHHAQNEWFYCIEGKFRFEVGSSKIELNPGDSLLAPMKVAHVWAYVGDKTGRILIAFSPAGKMEAFFRGVTKANAMPPQDPALWHEHGMELLGPPMSVIGE